MQPARPSRLRLAGAIHHVALRGHDGQVLFGGDGDRAALDGIVGTLLRESGARVHAYCWMSNHLHLVVEIPPGLMAGWQDELVRRYSRHRQQDALTGAPLFAPAEPAFRVDADAYLLQLIRYVHLNPLRAGLVRDAADYPWSGHRAYLGYDGPAWLSTDLGFRLLGGDLLRAAAAYRVFVAPVTTRVNRETLVTSLSYPGRY
jgi:REP element-mobilizing transposase RayT